MSFPKWSVRSQAFNDFWEQYGIGFFEDECSEGIARQIFAAGMEAATHFEENIKDLMRSQIEEVISNSRKPFYGSDE